MKKSRLWLYLGITAGFLSGFIYFAYGVYTYKNNKAPLKFDGSTTNKNISYLQDK